MIFIKLAVDAFGDDPITGYSQFVDSLIKRHTQNIYEAYQQTIVTIQYPNEIRKQLDDEVSRYADNELSFYSFEEKIDPSHYYIALNGRNEDGIKRVNDILSEIRAHNSYRGRSLGHKLVAVVSDEPQCIPCLKKKIEAARKGGV